MRIFRRGSSRNYGVTEVVRDRPLNSRPDRQLSDGVSWDANSKQVSVRLPSIPKGGDSTHHDYTVSFSLADISAILETVGREMYTNNRVHTDDGTNLIHKAIAKFLAYASGYTTTLLPPPKPR